MEGKGKSEILLVDMIGNVQIMLRYIFSKWLLIFMVSFCFGVLGILYAWLQKPTYIAEMSFTTESENSSRLNAYAGLAAQFGFDLGGGSNNIFEGDNIAELLTSRNLVETTLLTPSGNGKELMIDDYISFNRLKEAWKKDDKLRNIAFSQNRLLNTRLQDSILGEVSKDITMNQLKVFRKDKKLSIITAKMECGDEMFAKRFIELLASNVIQFYTDYKSRKALLNVMVLQHQTDSVRALLFGSISDVATMNDLNINPLRQSLKIPSQHRQIDVQVNSALYTELLKNLELSKLALRKETPLIQVIDQPVFPLEKKKLGRLKTGILFAFAAGCISIGILLIRRYFQAQFIRK